MHSITNCSNEFVSFSFTEEINLKIQIISKTFSDWQNVNVCAGLFKYSNIKIGKLVSNWKKDAKEFDQPSKFHFLAHALKVLSNNQYRLLCFNFCT
jgi:3-methyladenine DNA glycosylase AlkD